LLNPISRIAALAVIAILANLPLSDSTSANGLPHKGPIGYADRSAAIAITAEVRQAEFKPLSLLHESLWKRLQKGFEFSHIDNDRIDEQILFMQAGLRSLRSNLIDAGPYLYHIVQELERADVPLDIALLPLIESAFNPNARSSESAVGIWQFIPATAQHYGLSTQQKHDQRKDVVASTTAAIRYLKDLHRTFDGDWLLALAAYNTGPGNLRSAMRRAVKRNEEPVYWNLRLSEETNNYVPRLIAATKVIADPERYGLKLPPLPNRKQIESIAVGRRISFRQVADLLNMPLEKIAVLNPALEQGATPTDGPHKLTLPVEATGSLLSHLAKLKRGPLTESIAEFNDVDHSTVKAENDRTVNSHIAQSDITTNYSYLPVKSYKYKTHDVRPGDNLWTISNKINVDVATLREWNDLKPGFDDIQPGDKIRVAYLATDSGPAEAKLMNYRVSPTDTLASIANRFDLHIGDIKRWNKPLWHKSHVKAGQMLYIPTAATRDL